MRSGQQGRQVQVQVEVQELAQYVVVELGVAEFVTELVCRHLVELMSAPRTVLHHVELELSARTSCLTCLEADQHKKSYNASPIKALLTDHRAPQRRHLHRPRAVEIAPMLS